MFDFTDFIAFMAIEDAHEEHESDNENEDEDKDSSDW